MLKGKVALVTGSTSGIGLGIAHSLAEQGCNLIINGFGDAEEIEIIRKNLEDKYSVKALYINVDLSNGDEAVTLVEE